MPVKKSSSHKSRSEHESGQEVQRMKPYMPDRESRESVIIQHKEGQGDVRMRKDAFDYTDSAFIVKENTSKEKTETDYQHKKIVQMRQRHDYEVEPQARSSNRRSPSPGLENEMYPEVSNPYPQKYRADMARDKLSSSYQHTREIGPRRDHEDEERRHDSRFDSQPERSSHKSRSRSEWSSEHGARYNHDMRHVNPKDEDQYMDSIEEMPFAGPSNIRRESDIRNPGHKIRHISPEVADRCMDQVEELPVSRPSIMRRDPDRGKFAQELEIRPIRPSNEESSLDRMHDLPRSSNRARDKWAPDHDIRQVSPEVEDHYMDQRKDISLSVSSIKKRNIDRDQWAAVHDTRYESSEYEMRNLSLPRYDQEFQDGEFEEIESRSVRINADEESRAHIVYDEPRSKPARFLPLEESPFMIDERDQSLKMMPMNSKAEGLRQSLSPEKQKPIRNRDFSRYDSGDNMNDPRRYPDFEDLVSHDKDIESGKHSFEHHREHSPMYAEEHFSREEDPVIYMPRTKVSNMPEREPVDSEDDLRSNSCAQNPQHQRRYTNEGDPRLDDEKYEETCHTDFVEISPYAGKKKLFKCYVIFIYF